MKSERELRRGYDRCTRRVLELMQLWIDARTDHQATLLQAYCCAELLGLLPSLPS